MGALPARVGTDSAPGPTSPPTQACDWVAGTRLACVRPLLSRGRTRTVDQKRHRATAGILSPKSVRREREKHIPGNPTNRSVA